MSIKSKVLIGGAAACALALPSAVLARPVSLAVPALSIDFDN